MYTMYTINPFFPDKLKTYTERQQKFPPTHVHLTKEHIWFFGLRITITLSFLWGTVLYIDFSENDIRHTWMHDTRYL